jgi:hypothetical protein
LIVSRDRPTPSLAAHHMLRLQRGFLGDMSL